MALKPPLTATYSSSKTTLARAWAEIDLGAIRHNLTILKKHMGHVTDIMAVVKANAYGLGAISIGRTALQAGASSLAVSSCEEGCELREAGLPGQILVLGYVPPESAVAAVKANLTLTVNEPKLALALSQAVWQYSPLTRLPVQLKLDTGLHRYGLEPEAALELARLINGLPGLHLQGLYSHFAEGDSRDPAYIYEQMNRFDQTRALLAAHGFHFTRQHLASSAPAISWPATRRDAVRIGLAMLGYYPSEQSRSATIELQPGLTLKSEIARVSRLEPGEGVGYNRTFIAEQARQIALIPVGYADGYSRALSNKGAVLIRGKRAPVLGRIMMDQFVVDVSEHGELETGEEVVLIGRQGQSEIRLEEVAEACNMIPYEILTGLGPRVERIYKD